MKPLEVDVIFGDQPELRIRGELDAGTAHHVTTAVDYAIGNGCPDLVIDMRSVTFCDSAGVATLLAARQRSGRLRLRAPSPKIRRTLKAAGLDQCFDLAT